ncbi:VRR-NUC domain-containing protein [candidate division KSB1 bacterium]|nr:VRR-NUC domain-containing protein [candidate division KSB1 bacterium]
MIIVDNIQLQKVYSSKSKKAKYNFEGENILPEEAAIKFYNKKGYNAIWTENQFWWIILSLIFWDIIFAKIKGAVSYKSGNELVQPEPNDRIFQDMFNQFISMNGMPSDLFETDFYERRKGLIEKHLQQLSKGNLVNFLQNSYKSHFGKTCRLVEDWKKYTIDELLIPFKTCKPSQVLGILKRTISDIKEYRSGLPDLIVYNDNFLFFSEVKSENDKLKPNQIKWHKHLSENLYFDVEVLLINHNRSQKDKILNTYKESGNISPAPTPISKTVKVLPEPEGELINVFRAQVKSLPRGKQIELYFTLLNEIRELRSRKKFEQMLEKCKKSLPFIEEVIKWDESLSKQKWDGNIGLSMPAIESACDYLPIFEKVEELNIYRQFINEMPQLEYYKDSIENAFLMLKIVKKLKYLLNNNEYVLQKDLKKMIEVNDGRTISRVVKYLENTSIISRVKFEKTYKIKNNPKFKVKQKAIKSTTTPTGKKSFFKKLFGS